MNCRRVTKINAGVTEALFSRVDGVSVSEKDYLRKQRETNYITVEIFILRKQGTQQQQNVYSGFDYISASVLHTLLGEKFE